MFGSDRSRKYALDVLEPRAPRLPLGDRDRADHGVVEVAARGLVDLVFVDVEQRGETFSASWAASIASGRSPISRSGLIPNAGRPRSRNHTRLRQSGGVRRRHIRESSDFGSMTIGAASSSSMSLR